MSQDNPQADAAAALALRQQAAELLRRAGELDGLKPYTVIWSHRFGTSTSVVWADGLPSDKAAFVAAVFDDEFEEDRDESLEADPVDIDEVAGVAGAIRLAQIESQSEDEEPAPSTARETA